MGDQRVLSRSTAERAPTENVPFPPGENVVFTNYGCAAFELILQSQDLRGATILLPAYLCKDSFVELFDTYELDPIFVDVDSETYHMDFDAARNRATDVDLILFVHAFGVPATLDRWKRLAEKHDALLVEDCARALGAMDGTQPVGTAGDFAIYSLRKVSPVSSGGALVGPIADLDLPRAEFKLRDAHPLLPDSVRQVARSVAERASAVQSEPSDSASDGIGSPPPRRLDRLNEYLFRYHLRRGFDDRLRTNAALTRRLRPALHSLGVELQRTRAGTPNHSLAMTTPRRDELVERFETAGFSVGHCWRSPLATAYVSDLAEFPTTERLTREALQLPLVKLGHDDVSEILGIFAETLAE